MQLNGSVTRKVGVTVWSVSWQAYTDHSRQGSPRMWGDDEEQSERARRLLGDRDASVFADFTQSSLRPSATTRWTRQLRPSVI